VRFCRKLCYIVVFLLFVSCSVFERQYYELPSKNNDFTMSYVLYDLQDKTALSNYSDNELMIPASLQKIFSNIAALEILGPNKKFHTYLYHDGNIKENILYGNLYLIGKGDPTLDVSDLYNMAYSVKALGVNKIKGNIIYDDSYLPKAEKINQIQPNRAIYNPGYSALMVNHNQLYAKISEKHKTHILIPEIDHVKITKSKARTSDFHYKGKNIWSVNYRRAKILNRLPIKDSSLFTAEAFGSLISNLGIQYKKITKINNSRNTASHSNIEMIYHKRSKPLIDIVKSNLRYSNNLIAEIIALHVAKDLQCKVVDLQSSAQCIQNWYNKKFPYLDWNRNKWENNSGLSTVNLTSAAQIIELLKYAKDKRYAKQYLPSLMPISGMSGTLRKRFYEQSMKIYAKTGNMYFVSNLAGYLIKDGRLHAFVIMINNKNMRQRIDDKAVTDIDSALFAKPAKRWQKNSHKIQYDLINSWLE
jgi:serine-type D-Ala-D-Ala carboxypeptidase/endopeptidase (penicillin-binding protein 4)